MNILKKMWGNTTVKISCVIVAAVALDFLYETLVGHTNKTTSVTKVIIQNLKGNKQCPKVVNQK
jgi:hypothetical protein